MTYDVHVSLSTDQPFFIRDDSIRLCACCCPHGHFCPCMSLDLDLDEEWDDLDFFCEFYPSSTLGNVGDPFNDTGEGCSDTKPSPTRPLTRMVKGSRYSTAIDHGLGPRRERHAEYEPIVGGSNGSRRRTMPNPQTHRRRTESARTFSNGTAPGKTKHSMAGSFANPAVPRSYRLLNTAPPAMPLGMGDFFHGTEDYNPSSNSTYSRGSYSTFTSSDSESPTSTTSSYRPCSCYHCEPRTYRPSSSSSRSRCSLLASESTSYLSTRSTNPYAHYHPPPSDPRPTNDFPWAGDYTQIRRSVSPPSHLPSRRVETLSTTEGTRHANSRFYNPGYGPGSSIRISEAERHRRAEELRRQIRRWRDGVVVDDGEGRNGEASQGRSSRGPRRLKGWSWSGNGSRNRNSGG